MATYILGPENAFGERSIPSIEAGEGRAWGWICFSGLVHAIFISSLFLVPYLPLPKPPTYPIYTVELVGGEKLGAVAPAASVAPPPAAKKESLKAKEEVPPRPTVKERKKKAVEHKAEMAEKIMVAKAKKEENKAEKKEQKKEEPAEAQAQQALPVAVRDKLIQAALEKVKNRAESEQKKQQKAAATAATTTGAAEKPGAAAAGAGGSGGGIVKGIEYIRYRNKMLERIQSSWTWVGKRTDLQVTVQFSIQENGGITGLKLSRGSGDLSYDDSVIRALKKANPLPPLPENSREELRDWELIFTPKDLGR